MADTPGKVQRQFKYVTTQEGEPSSWWKFWEEQCVYELSWLFLRGPTDGVLSTAFGELPANHSGSIVESDACHAAEWPFRFDWSLRSPSVLRHLCWNSPIGDMDVTLCQE